MANNAVRLIAPVLLGALILLFPAGGLRALGLGEARVDSWLGQPLDVSIRLLDIQSEEIESISVGPASLEDHERLGVPSESMGLGLEVTVDRRVDPPRVRVRSQQPVNDPVVQILIDARWASGRVLREYTLFLDPPVVESAAPVRRVSETADRPVAEPEPTTAPAPAEEAARPATRPAPQPSESADFQPTEPEPASATRGADAVDVAAGDTLWSIASNWRPDQGLSMDQVMLAIFNRNRSAFLGENINRLRSDVRLDMPSIEDVRGLDREEAERRIREHMRSWQPSATQEVPTVSDAAMPERETEAPAATEPEPVSQPEEPAEEMTEEMAEETAEEASEETAQPASEASAEPVHRLDVVPPEDDQYSEAAAVPQGDIDRVQNDLADVESEIVEEGIESEELDQRIQEVRDALEQRDMAGLAVAEESLAELESRLREVREAQAESSAMTQGVDDMEESGTDEVADYMRQLEEEFAADEDEQTAMTGDGESADTTTEPQSDEAADDPADDASPAGEADSEQEVAEAPVGESGADAEEERPMTVTRTGSDGLSAWLWPAVGLLVLILAVVAVVMWLRGRGGEAAGRSAGGSDAVDSARAAVARDPADLGARLALLKALADEGDDEAFTDAFDQMYQEVEDETAPEWQEAVSLAAVHAPDHPLLRPHETEVGGDEDFDRRADEMLGMLESDSDEEADEDTSYSDDTFDLDLERDDATGERRAERGESDETKDEKDQDERFDTDMDLAVLSERLDDPSSRRSLHSPSDESEDDANFEEFEEIDEYAAPDTESEDEALGLEDQETVGPDLDLDFGPAREQESDEVFGEAGARDKEDLDLEFSSDADEADEIAPDDTVHFAPGDTLAGYEEETPGAESEAEDDEPPQDADSAPESEAPEPEERGGGTLSDEDADVKLDLARAYISVDLADSARAVLEEVIGEGSEEKRDEAQKLLDGID
ncbi:MAG: hypothetical protein GVY32_02095 [Gammaproteobacteria bacterium]|jgi:pilus assembly protein FimV|nr:hypothetical protein [Gammaproteobacteria bacterium]